MEKKKNAKQAECFTGRLKWDDGARRGLHTRYSYRSVVLYAAKAMIMILHS